MSLQVGTIGDPFDVSGPCWGEMALGAQGGVEAAPPTPRLRFRKAGLPECPIPHNSHMHSSKLTWKWRGARDNTTNYPLCRASMSFHVNLGRGSSLPNSLDQIEEAKCTQATAPRKPQEDLVGLTRPM